MAMICPAASIRTCTGGSARSAPYRRLVSGLARYTGSLYGLALVDASARLDRSRRPPPQTRNACATLRRFQTSSRTGRLAGPDSDPADPKTTQTTLPRNRPAPSARTYRGRDLNRRSEAADDRRRGSRGERADSSHAAPSKAVAVIAIVSCYSSGRSGVVTRYRSLLPDSRASSSARGLWKMDSVGRGWFGHGFSRGKCIGYDAKWLFSTYSLCNDCVKYIS